MNKLSILSMIIYVICFQILYLLNTVTGLMVILEKKKVFCIRKDVTKGDTVQFSYIVSGDENVEKNVNVTMTELANNVTSKKDINKYSNYNSNTKEYLKEDDITLEVKRNAYLNYCFDTKLDNTIVSFEFFTMNESGHILSLAKDEVFEEMYKNVTIIGYMFEEIEKNLKYFVERRDIHSKSTIQQVTTLKVAAILIISLIQILFIRKLFHNKRGEKAAKGSYGNNFYDSSKTEIEMNPFIQN